MSLLLNSNRLFVLLALILFTVPQPAVSEEDSSFNVMFQKRLTLWISRLEDLVIEHEAKKKTSVATQTEAVEFLKQRDVQRNSDVSSIFIKAKFAARKSVRQHKRAIRKIKSRIRRIEEIQSYMLTETFTPEQGVILDFRGPIKLERNGQPVENTDNSKMPYVLKAGDYLDIGEGGNVTFLHPETGAEVSIGEYSKARLNSSKTDLKMHWLLEKGKIKYELNKKYNKINNEIIAPVGRALKPKPKFQISTKGGAFIGVRGTAFTFEYDEKGTTEVILWEGMLEITPWVDADEFEFTAPARMTIKQDRAIIGPTPLTNKELERIKANETSF